MAFKEKPALVKLSGNATQFKGNADINIKGNADININGKPTITNAPIVFYLLNGKLVNLTIGPPSGKTYNPFPLPLFGIVTQVDKLENEV